jgi:hypothetical protein
MKQTPQQPILDGMVLPAPTPLVESPPRGGLHDGSRVDSEKKAMMVALFAQGVSKHQIAQQTDSTWKVVDAVVDPRRRLDMVTLEQRAEVVSMLMANQGFDDVVKATGLSLRTVAAIAKNDPAVVMELQKSRGHRAVVAEAIVMEGLLDTAEKRLESGKATMAELANALMVINGMARDTLGAAPIRVSVEADESLMAAMQMFGGGMQPMPVVEAEVVVSSTAEDAA